MLRGGELRAPEGTARSRPRDEEGLPAESGIERSEWRAESARSLALAARKDHRASLESFQAAYAAFPGNDESTTREMLNLVIGLVARGSPPRKLLAVLSGDPAKSAGLCPLMVALHELAGDAVRAPREVAEVAGDIGGWFSGGWGRSP